MKSAILSLTMCLLLGFATVAVAQTGKIAGRVTDATSGGPIPGVNIVIDGTTQGTTSDVDGFYTILNVAPGTYALRASFIGYTPQTVQGVVVNIDLTTEVDFSMQEETVGLEEVVVTAAPPVIQRDVSGSQRNVSEEDIEAGRFQNISNVVTAQVGVNDAGAFDDRPRIRGSNFSEALFLVDGVNQGDVLTNTPVFQVNLDAVEEVKVQTGGFDAEYGNVRSGIVNVVTREGGERYSGSINLQYSPPALKNFGPDMFGFESPVVQPFVNPDMGAFEGGNDFFPGWNAVAEDAGLAGPHMGNPMELYARYLWRHRSEDAIDELKRLQDQGIVQFKDGVDPDDLVWQQSGRLPDYRMSFTFGGPVPLVDPVSFFVSYDRNATEYMHRFPEAAYTDDNIRGKITADVARGIKLNLHGFYSQQSGGDGGQGPGIGGFVSSNPFVATDATNKMWYPHCAVPGTRTRQIYGAKWTHTLSASTFYEINLTHDRVDYEMNREFRNTAPIPGTGGITSSSGTSGSGIDAGLIGSTADAEARAAAGAEGWENWRDWALLQIGDYWYDEGPKGYGPVNWRDITGEYRMESCNLRADETYSRGWDFNASFTSQVTRSNLVKAGIQVRRDEINQYYEAIDPSVNAGSVWDSKITPWRGALFVQDKLEYRGFVANVGLRLDWMSSGTFPGVLEDCDLENASECVGQDGPYSEFLQAGNTTVETEDGRVLGTRETVITQNLDSQRHTQTKLSPRIGVSHPISTVAKIFFNYGHFYQWPTALEMYQIQMDTRNGFRVSNFGNPLLEPERTIQYEIGYEQNLFDKMSLRLTGYYKDINNEIADVEIFPLGYGGSDYNTYLNMAFRDVRGLEAFLEMRRNVLPYVSGWISFNYLVESGAEYGYDRFYENPSDQARLAQTEVSKPDVRPLVKVNFNFSTPDDFYGPMLGETSLLGGFSIDLLYTWQRGEAFTWNPANYPLVEDNVRWNPYQRFDLRLNKTLFRRGTLESVFYIDVTNLFNNRNMTAFDLDFDDEEVNNVDQGWAWNSHRWWNNQDRDYLYSLGYTPENQNRDGSFNNTIGDPGDWDDDAINLPGFSPFTFLGKRDVFFGIKFYF